MADNKPYIDETGEVRELDDQFFANAKRGRPPMPVEERKKRVNLMLDQDLIKALKATGNMSGVVNDEMRKALGL